jgi:tRNA pseudouridine32 synthase / 23S rRNA pseudouridine746 synthase
VTLHSLTDFISDHCVIGNEAPTYWYEGYCPNSGTLLTLPRTAFVEAIAHGLMRQLDSLDAYANEGKMYGVLLVETPFGEQRVLKAFSGLLNGRSVIDGWVPPVPGRQLVVLEEAHTLAQLDCIKQELLSLQQIPERQQYDSLRQRFTNQLQELAQLHAQRKHERQLQREYIKTTLVGDELAEALEQLNHQSQRDGMERRDLKRQRNSDLQPLKQILDITDTKIRALKQQRKLLSRQLQMQMNAAYNLTNFAGQSLSLKQLMPQGVMPTGTGECCAPKLLHYAATHQLKPLAMAEFWWGPTSTDKKIQSEFYGACAERCQPLMGFLLSGMSARTAEGRRQKADGKGFSSALCPLPFAFLYEDEWLIVVNKPAGLLSVPGRSSDRQDSVLSRLQRSLSDGLSLTAVHRLDQDTSGILLFARDPKTHRHLVQQFQQHQVHKVYEAVLAGIVTADSGTIDLPLWGDPTDRPHQKVDWQRGKLSITYFQVITRDDYHTRVVFMPTTGRTHQLRVHAADSQGLGVPILGDRLYGTAIDSVRLHLHARELQLTHPKDGRSLYLHCPTPF